MSHSTYLRQLHRPSVSIGYGCSLCRSFYPLRHLYFCTDCRVLLCPSCTDVHIDTFYCPSCLTAVFSSSAQSSLGRCDQCVECPACQHTLQTAFHSSSQLYSFLCPACRWASYDKRHPNAPSSLSARDVTVLLAGVRAHEADEGGRNDVQRLTAQHRQRFKTVQQEKKLEGERRLTPTIGGASTQPTSAALYTAAAAGFRPTTEMSGLQRFLVLDGLVAKQRRAVLYNEDDHSSSRPPVPASVTVPVPDYYKGHFATPSNGAAEPAGGEESKEGRIGEELVYGIGDIASLSSRLSHPSTGLHPPTVHPRRRPLLTKLAHRCPQCTKFVIKPGPGAGKVSFEIQHSAFSLVPRLTLGNLPASWAVGKPVRIIVYITNPVERELRIRFQAVLSNSAAGTSADEEKKLQLVEEEEKKEVVESGSTAALQPPLWSALPSTPSCSASVQSDWVHLSAYDDIVEESAVWQDKQKQASEQFKDNPQLVASRHLSKVGVYVTVTPLRAQTAVQVSSHQLSTVPSTYLMCSVLSRLLTPVHCL